MKMKNENKESGREQKELTPQQLQRRRKLIVFPLFFLLFAGSMWLIFAPSTGEKEHQEGFNADIPMPREEGLVGDKRDAYEQESMKQKEAEKRRSLQDFAFMLGEEESMPEEEYYDSPSHSAGVGEQNPSRSPGVYSSRAAYQEMNRQLAWYDQPATEIDEQSQLALEWRIQELERRLEEEDLRKKSEDGQLSIMEKSYQLAAKYMPGANGQGAVEGNGNTGSTDKLPAQPVCQVRHNVVSLLSAPVENDEFTEQFSHPRNRGFLTAAGNEGVTDPNSIGASVYQTVTLTSGKEVQLRLHDPMLAGNNHIPAGTILCGAAKINGDRLDVTITSIQYAGTIIPVELRVYDTDGQQGIFIPNSDEITAAKEIAAGLSNSAGSNIMISDKAGSQLAADLGKGLIQGSAQYVSKKLQTVKVTLKAGYRVLLLPKNE